jgi:AraC-like DNA-binding protein
LAERYLQAERYTLTDISQMLGFTAPSAFSRWFRQRFGVSPTQWRSSQPTTTG